MSNEEVYDEVPNDPSALKSTIFTALNKIRTRVDLSADTLEYFFNNRKNGRPVISDCRYHKENISSFLVESYIKDTNHFLKMLKKSVSLPKKAILCPIDVVGLYPNIPHEEGLASIKKHLDNRENKEVKTNTSVELADKTLKNNYFHF